MKYRIRAQIFLKATSVLKKKSVSMLTNTVWQSWIGFWERLLLGAHCIVFYLVGFPKKKDVHSSQNFLHTSAFMALSLSFTFLPNCFCHSFPLSFSCCASCLACFLASFFFCFSVFFTHRPNHAHPPFFFFAFSERFDLTGFSGGGAKDLTY